jgi:hypothetical protein
MPLGIAVGLIFLYKICSILKYLKCNIFDILTLTMLLIIAGHVYPHMWLIACVITVVFAAVCVWAGERAKAIALLAAMLLGSLAIIPYLRTLTGGRDQGLSAMFVPNLRVFAYHVLHVAIILLPLWLFIAARGRSLLEQLRTSWVHWAVLGSGLSLLLAFLVLYGPATPYKFRAMAVFCLAPLAAPGLKRIYDWNKTALVVILSLQLLPLFFSFYDRTPWGWGSAAEPCYWQGTVLRHGVSEEDGLYQWIREHTPTTAILVDNKPYVPVYSRRSLLVARQQPDWRQEDFRRRRDGWLYSPHDLLELVNGHSADDIRHRNDLVDGLYANVGSESGEDFIRQLDDLTEQRPVFVVARNGTEKAALERRSFLRKVAEESFWAVYALVKEKTKSQQVSWVLGRP